MPLSEVLSILPALAAPASSLTARRRSVAKVPGPHRLRGDHADEVLAVDVVELGEVVAAGDLVGELVVHAAQGRLSALNCHRSGCSCC
jgi:hypothetical protein